jgi:hypothetical protein
MKRTLGTGDAELLSTELQTLEGCIRSGWGEECLCSCDPQPDPDDRQAHATYCPRFMLEVISAAHESRQLPTSSFTEQEAQ